MSSIEMDLAPGINSRRAEITDIQTQLQELNQQFPGERNKSYGARNPEYLAQRTHLLDRTRLLQVQQIQARRTLRQS